MFLCEVCNREFKSKRGLSMHSNNCVEPEQIPEEVFVVDTDNELSDAAMRQIAKLEDAKNSCYDAKTKHELEMKIMRLKEG